MLIHEKAVYLQPKNEKYDSTAIDTEAATEVVPIADSTD
jgi:hypothetical protein